MYVYIVENSLMCGLVEIKLLELIGRGTKKKVREKKVCGADI